MKRLITSFMIVIVLLSTISTPASALSCAEPRPPEEELEIVDVVFRGVANKIRDGLVTFDVSMVWKGEASSHFIVQENEMWKEFDIGTEYIVYAREGNGTLFVNLCGNSKEWTAAVHDVKYFVEPRIPIDNEAPTVITSGVIYFIIIVLLIVAMIGIVLYRKRKRMK